MTTNPYLSSLQNLSSIYQVFYKKTCGEYLRLESQQSHDPK